MGAEKNFENQIKRFLKKEGCWFIKYWSGGVPTKEGMKKFTKSGIPDILVCCKGVFIGLEIKAPRGVPSALQIRSLKQIHDAGGVSVLLYPEDFHMFQLLVGHIQSGNCSGLMKVSDYFMDQVNTWFTKYKLEGLMT